ncbi:MAG TPA: hypothetical protein VLX31_00330 [Streptosporangiaceae bacterium]|nr:hypothetical protein [Streptosporangiaceae bacterium]
MAGGSSRARRPVGGIHEVMGEEYRIDEKNLLAGRRDARSAR